MTDILLTNRKDTVNDVFFFIMRKKYTYKKQHVTNFEFQYVGLEVEEHSLSSHL